MKILLLGCNGQAGWELQRSLAPLGELTALGRQGRGDLCGDLSEPDSLAVTVTKLAPDVIVNAAAYTAVDQAEAEPENARRINAKPRPGWLARRKKQAHGLSIIQPITYLTAPARPLGVKTMPRGP